MSADWPDLPLLADTSAWSWNRAVEVHARWRAALVDDRVVTTGPVRLEVLYSARNAAEFDVLESRLGLLRNLPISEGTVRSAIGAMWELTRLGDGAHRASAVDYMIGAVAAEAGVAVLHYDRHFDRLASVLGFESVWLAPAGTLTR